MTAIDQCRDLIKEGIYHVSAAKAAKILNVSAEAMTMAAKEGRLGIPFLFSGRNLHVSVNGMIRFLEGQ